jgi:hypothetical protein
VCAVIPWHDSLAVLDEDQLVTVGYEIVVCENKVDKKMTRRIRFQAERGQNSILAGESHYLIEL